MYTVGQSKTRTWRTCRQAYDFKYEQKLRRNRTRRPFMFGTIVHRMIEANEQGDDPMAELRRIAEEKKDIFTAEREMYGEIIDDIAIIMKDYFEYHNDGLKFIPVKDETGEYRFAEHEFAVPLKELVDKSLRKTVDGIVFEGQVDGLGKTPNKLRWLIEHKSFDKLPSDDERWRNVQSTVYIRVALHLGWIKTIDGVCWNYVKSKAPTVPQVIKDGSRLSAADIVTLPSVVRAALKVHKLSEKDHQKLMDRAYNSRRDYFQRHYVPFNEGVAEAIFAGFVETAIEMRDNAGKKKDKNIGRQCSWCDYEPLCRTELTGGDVDFVREREFSVEEPDSYRRSKRSDKLKVIKE